MSIKEKLQNKPKAQINRQDISDLLKSIGKPNQKKREKIEAIRELGLKNLQGVDVADVIEEYEEF